MNIRIEVAKFEPKPTFENIINDTKYDINDIKDNLLKSFAYTTFNLPAITFLTINLNSLV